ncbi:circadian clock KaiB family protein [Methyloversatilis sp.]|uniref:circadian clock KaiB family protein n=1 Tax=Methyloversatilis sp. TaxID=2569862 RepID=UPI003F7176AB
MTAPVPRLTLYLAGDSPASRRARTNLTAALAALHITLPVRTVDVLAEPEEALAERIYVTPALLLHVAGQREMLVGDFSQTEAVAMALAPLAPSAPDTPGRQGEPA